MARRCLGLDKRSSKYNFAKKTKIVSKLAGAASLIPSPYSGGLKTGAAVAGALGTNSFTLHFTLAPRPALLQMTQTRVP